MTTSVFGWMNLVGLNATTIVWTSLERRTSSVKFIEEIIMEITASKCDLFLILNFNKTLICTDKLSD